MHQCEEFRERITEHIIDREDLTTHADFQRELLVCARCSEFYAESREMIDAMSSMDLEKEISENHWDAMNHRLRMRIINDRVRLDAKPHPGGWNLRTMAPALAGIAAVLLVTLGINSLVNPLIEDSQRASKISQSVFIDRKLALDPVTVDFLEQSELLLRNVMKLAPDDAEDLADAKKLANAQLIDLPQRKEAAATVPPVVTVMDTYEMILRDIRNLDGQSAAEDISDIQSRIQKNAMIANMKAFQPSVNVVEIEH